jgi:hypothetical protein
MKPAACASLARVCEPVFLNLDTITIWYKIGQNVLPRDFISNVVSPRGCGDLFLPAVLIEPLRLYFFA